MWAVIHSEKSGMEGIKFQQVPSKQPGTGEVKVMIKTAGLNHRDLFVIQRRTESDLPLVLGSDGAGIVEAIGEGVKNVRIGDEVIINPSLKWKLASEVPETIEIVGSPTDGTFAESVIVPAENVEPKPSYLSWEEAGVLPLAALTAYRALFTRGQVKEGERVLIPGIGSGVATFLLPMAKAAGASVTVTSRDENKRRAAMEMGADFAIDSKSNWEEVTGGEKFDLVIDSIGSATFPRYLSVLRSGGRIVNFGATTGDQIELSLRTFFYAQFTLMGTSMGSAEEFGQMLRFIELHKIRPVIDRTYPLSDTFQAFNHMEDGKQFGKICLAVKM